MVMTPEIFGEYLAKLFIFILAVKIVNVTFGLFDKKQ